jgi:hypothetical protein
LLEYYIFAFDVIASISYSSFVWLLYLYHVTSHRNVIYDYCHLSSFVCMKYRKGCYILYKVIFMWIDSFSMTDFPCKCYKHIVYHGSHGEGNRHSPRKPMSCYGIKTYISKLVHTTRFWITLKRYAEHNSLKFF